MGAELGWYRQDIALTRSQEKPEQDEYDGVSKWHRGDSTKSEPLYLSSVFALFALTDRSTLIGTCGALSVDDGQLIRKSLQCFLRGMARASNAHHFQSAAAYAALCPPKNSALADPSAVSQGEVIRCFGKAKTLFMTDVDQGHPPRQSASAEDRTN